MKGWNEYFKINENIQEESPTEITASELGLMDCKIIGVSVSQDGKNIQLQIRDNSSLLGYSNISIKDGKIVIYTKFMDE